VEKRGNHYGERNIPKVTWVASERKGQDFKRKSESRKKNRGNKKKRGLSTKYPVITICSDTLSLVLEKRMCFRKGQKAQELFMSGFKETAPNQGYEKKDFPIVEEKRGGKKGRKKGTEWCIHSRANKRFLARTP